MMGDTQDISKMKVTEIKKELKARGLSTAGTKVELLERLKAAACETTQDEASEDGNDESEILDEDDVLGEDEEGGDFDDDDLAADTVLADEPKLKPSPPTASVKRPAPLSAEPTIEEVQPKKRILVRPISVSSEKENGSQEKDSKMDVDEEKTDAKKIIKLSGVTLKERLELRAQKFGVPLSDTAKKEARAARFGAGSNPSNSVTSTVLSGNKTGILKPSEEVLKKRAERFGGNVSTLALKVEEQDKLQKRKERFAASAVSTGSLEEKKKLRAERFKL